MKKIFTILIFTAVLFFSVPIVFAGQDEILPKEIIQPVDSKTSQKALPTGDFRFEIIPKAIKLMLALVGTVSVVVFVYAGVMLVIAQGNEEDLKKFKEILIWSIVGLLFITLSYAIVTGVMQLVFK